MKRLLCTALIGAFALTACTGTVESGSDSLDDTETEYIPQTSSSYTGERADDFADDIIDTDDSDNYWENSTFDKQISIVYDGTTATVNDATSQAVVTKDGAHVAVDLAANALSGVQITLSGTSTDGSLKVYSGKKYKLVLNGVSLTSTRGAAINNQSEKRTFVVINGDNYLTDAAEYTSDVYYTTGASIETEDEKGCFFSEPHLIFSGNGLLSIIGNHKHALATDDTFYMRPGVTLVVQNCAVDAIHVNEGVTVAGGLINIEKSNKDGIECEEGAIKILGGHIIVNSDDDAIAATYAEDDTTVTPDIVVSGGRISLTTAAAKGMGLKAEGNIAISGGTIDIAVSGTASKCLKSTLDTSVTDGTLTLSTSGNATYDTAEADTASASCIKTGGNLTIGGTAVIAASSSGTGGKGISTDGNLVVDGGNVTIKTTGGQFVYSASKVAAQGPGGGGWHPDNDNNDSGITSSSKGIRVDGTITINGGTIDVTTTQTAASSDGSGCEGIESKSTIAITGGEINVLSFDDGINAASGITISGGRTCSYSYYNDGVDSNGTLTVSGGLTIASGTRAPEEGIDCDQNTFKITGGTIIGTGGATSSPTTSVCTQRSLLVQNLSMTQGKVLNIKNAAGTTILNYAMPRTLSGTTLLVSTPAIASGAKYTFSTGGTVASAENVWNGYYTGGTYTGGTTVNPTNSIK